jgi:error-prone DNA polymerase
MADAMGRVLRFPTPHAPSAPAGGGWAELHVHSASSFLTGASHPEDLVAEAGRLGIEIMAITDTDGLYAARRFAEAAAEHGVGTVYGAELTLGQGLGSVVVLARSLLGFTRLSAAISAGQLAGAKGAPVYDLDGLSAAAREGEWAVLTGCPVTGDAAYDAPAIDARLGRLVELFGHRHLHVELVDHRLPEDGPRNDALHAAAQRRRLPVVASNAVRYAAPRSARLAAALAALHRRQDLDTAAGHLPPAPAAHLRTAEEMATLMSRYPDAVATAVDLARHSVVALDRLRPQLPDFDVPAGHTPDGYLRRLAEEGCTRRYGTRAEPAAAAAWKQLDHELTVIAELGMAGYFLICWDIVRFATEQSIWCQGRGSAASSVVCYALGITSVDALRHGLLFERFLHAEKADPDIDIDFENDRREEVIQYLYTRYGRDHAAQVANLITYQPRLSVRDAARALGYPAARISEMTRHIHHEPPGPELDVPDDVRELAAQLHTLPRHLGIHVGGMVLTRQPIGEIMPVEWATREGRSVLQGDKDDVAAAGLLKIDILGLGMLAALHTACDLIAEHHGVHLDMASIPQDDPDVYAMIAAGRTIGVFQAESRAQISTLPQLVPKTFDDLAVAASIIRPGPIQAGSKHPYLRRRRGEEPVTYPHPLAEPALSKTLGVALWQEQAMALAIDCAGFTPGEADRLRKAMAAKHAPERVAALRGRLFAGMAANGIGRPAAEKIVGMIEAFSDYGFPQSHAQSMAGIIYASAWIKHHYPHALLAAIMAHLPMGFYDSQTLIQDAKHHGIEVRGVDITRSGVHATLEPRPAQPDRRPAIRRGLTSVTGVSEDVAERILGERGTGPFRSPADVARRARLSARLMEHLAIAGAFDRFGGDRRTALWSAGAYAGEIQPVLPGMDDLAPAPALPALTAADATAADLAATGASAAHHPAEHLRPELARRGAIPAREARRLADHARIVVGGLAKYIQRPPTAKGVVFGALEDETGMINLVFSPPVWERSRQAVLEAPAVLLAGHLERDRGSVNLIVHRARALDGPERAHSPGRFR